MSDIQPGDVVVCVDADNCPLLRLGRHYRVTGLDRTAGYNRHGRWLEYGLFLAGIRGRFGRGAFDYTRFRKIRPADPEFIARIARIKQGEPA